jgi:Protein of unknown function DUF262
VGGLQTVVGTAPAKCDEPFPVARACGSGDYFGMERTHVSIRALVDRVDHGIKLPEIQRAYVWKPHQVAHLFDSLYRRYPSGAMLPWRPSDSVAERALHTGPPSHFARAITHWAPE